MSSDISDFKLPIQDVKDHSDYHSISTEYEGGRHVLNPSDYSEGKPTETTRPDKSPFPSPWNKTRMKN